MFVYGVDDFLGSGADFVALLGFCPLHCALGVAFGLGLRSDRVPLSGLLGRAVVQRLAQLGRNSPRQLSSRSPQFVLRRPPAWL